MNKPNKAERDARRAKCAAAGAVRLKAISEGKATADELLEMRGSVMRGDCPFCGETGFLSIAGHIRLMHGVSTGELRDMLGITYTTSICAPVLHNKLAEIHKDKKPYESLKKYSRKLSVAGAEIMKKSTAAWSKSVSPELKAKAGKKGGAAGLGKRRTAVAHGTFREWRKGCRCDLCLEAQRKHWQEWRAARKESPND